MSTCFDPPRPRRRRQAGEVLLEALFGVLITSLIGAGLMHVQARLMAAQRVTKVERLVVGKLREQLHVSGTSLCAAGTVPLELTSSLQMDAAVTCGAATDIQVSLGGFVLDVPAPSQVDLSVASADLELGEGASSDGGVDLLLSSRQ